MDVVCISGYIKITLKGGEVSAGSGEKVQGSFFIRGENLFQKLQQTSHDLIIQDLPHGHSYLQRRLEKILAFLDSILSVQ